MADRLGSLEAGKLADLITVRMDRARQTPLYDPISHLVYTTRGDDVDTTIVNGQVLMRGRKSCARSTPRRCSPRLAPRPIRSAAAVRK